MSFFSTIKGLISDTVARPIRVDSSTHAISVIQQAHTKYHDGYGFYVKGFTDIANSANLDFLWVVADTTAWPHAEWEIGGEGELSLYLYEDVTTSNDGASATIFNINRNSTNTPGVTVFTGPTLNSGALGDSGDGGDLVWSAKIASGGKNSAAASSRVNTYEFIGKQGKKYWFRINNASGGTLYCDYDFNWYEHTNRA